MKTVYFGKVPKKFWESDDFIKISGKTNKEKHYYYKLDIGEDDVWLTDSCGRGLPISKDHLGDLINVLLVEETD